MGQERGLKKENEGQQTCLMGFYFGRLKGILLGSFIIYQMLLPAKVRSMKFCRLGLFMYQYSLLVNTLQ